MFKGIGLRKIGIIRICQQNGPDTSILKTMQMQDSKEDREIYEENREILVERMSGVFNI